MESKKDSANAVVNALTVDVEDYFQVEAFSDVVSRNDWLSWESRIEKSTRRLLEVFESRQVRGTFFILGWIAEHFPRLVKEISDGGHEIACHGYHHELIRNQSRDTFRADIRKAKTRLEDITGKDVYGYRAPTYSITTETLWALDILIEEGFRYDSSIFPVHHDRYGIPAAKRFPHNLTCKSGEIIEFPPSTVRFVSQNLPFAGGGYFRFFPYAIFRWGLSRINRVEGRPAIFMIHAWEVDPDQPVIRGSRLNIIRHRNNLHKTESRLRRLLDDFQFAPVHEVLNLAANPAGKMEAGLIGSDPVYARMD